MLGKPKTEENPSSSLIGRSSTSLCCYSLWPTLFSLNKSFALIWLFIICAVLQLLLTTIILGAMSRVSAYPNCADNELPFLSIIIAARNEGDNLKKFLPFVLEQDYPDFEVIVVNNDSTDDSEVVLQKADHPLLRSFSYANDSDRKGKKAALSFGITQAKGDYFVFTDADCQPSDDQWLRRFGYAFYKKNDVVLGSGMFNHKSGMLNALYRLDSFRILSFYLTAAMLKKPYMGVGRSMGYTREVFQKVNGFSGHLGIASGDDDLFIQSLPKTVQVAAVPQALTLSDAPVSIWAWFLQKKRHLSTGSSYSFTSLVVLAVIELSAFIAALGLLVSPLLFNDEFFPYFIAIISLRLALYFLSIRWLESLTNYKSGLSRLFLWEIILSLMNPVFSVASQLSKPSEWISRT
jgi:glycosyltransferase involved in cell wall biosynthesis